MREVVRGVLEEIPGFRVWAARVPGGAGTTAATVMLCVCIFRVRRRKVPQLLGYICITYVFS